MVLLTHDDRFHADDVFATAVTKMFFGDKITNVVRSRDPELIKSADIVLDVGGENNPSKLRFDHHQPEGAGVRDNGIPYASFGLVWKEWGANLCGGSQEAAKIVDSNLVSPIDAGDNGFSIVDRREGLPREYSIASMVTSFGSTWKESDDLYRTNFDILVDFAQKILEREISQAVAKVEAEPLIESAFENAEDKRILILDEYWPWKTYIEKYPEVLFVVSPSKQGDKWRVNAVQEESFKNKKNLPESWSGLRDEEFQAKSGVHDAIFCHRALFMAAARSREGAVALAKLAIEK